MKRANIISTIITELKGINGSSPYNLNLSNRVFDSRVNEFDESECPAINVVEGEEIKEQELLSGSTNVWYRALQVRLQLYVNGENAAADTRKGIADIMYALSDNLTMSGNAIDTRWEGISEPERVHEDKKIFRTTVNISVLYSTTQWQTT